MPELKLEIAMKPQPKLRARVCNGRAFTPQKTINAEAEIRFLALKQLVPGFVPISGPIALELRFSILRPAAAKKRLHPSVRPDIDNLIKLVADGLNGVLWVDDALVYKITAEKVYAEKEGIDILVSY